jgi:N-acetylglutamate synthase-like GNAT family acetyltransferase
MIMPREARVPGRQRHAAETYPRQLPLWRLSVRDVSHLLIGLPMVETVTICQEMTADFPKVQAFYASVGYFGMVTEDCTVISAKCGDDIIGAVRLAPENGVLVLRGMQIAPSYQRKGIGTRMLREVSKFIGSRECFCLPHAWLRSFYGIIGFARIEGDDAPPHLRERLAEYRKKHWRGILMRRAATAL